MARAYPAKKSDAIGDVVRLSVGIEVPTSAPHFLQELLERMVEAFQQNLQLTKERGLKNGYGDALSPTGGVLNTYAIIERKQDRLRSQVWRRGLDHQPVPYREAFDTINDEINYLLYLKFQLEDSMAEDYARDSS